MSIKAIILLVIFALIIFNLFRAMLKNPSVSNLFSSGGIWKKASELLGFSFHDLKYPLISGVLDSGLEITATMLETDGVSITRAHVKFKHDLSFRMLIKSDDGLYAPHASCKEFSVDGLPGVRIFTDSPDALHEYLTKSRIVTLKNISGASFSSFDSFTFTENFADFTVAKKFETAEEIADFVEQADMTASIFSSYVISRELAGKQNRENAITPETDDFVSPEVAAPENTPRTNNAVRTFTTRPDSIAFVDDSEKPPEIFVNGNVMNGISPLNITETPAPLKMPEIISPEPPAPENRADDASVMDDLSGAVGIDALAEKLFSSSFAGAAEDKIFASVKGREVEWTGTLKTVYPFFSDFVFGRGPGAKATFEIQCTYGASAMKSHVKVTVRITEDEGCALKALCGRNLTFTGVLLKFDAFGKEIFLDSGSIKQ